VAFDADPPGRPKVDRPEAAPPKADPPAEMTLARRMWQLFEPVHAVTYFAPEAVAAYSDAGLRGFWRSYFAGRAAPLGAPDAAPVTASFFVFAPAMVARALPDVWSRITPERALETRLAGARAALAQPTAGIDPDRLARLAELMRTAARNVAVGGRPLAAANQALPWPDDPVGILWQATTILREHRGDGHVAALVTAGLDGIEATVWRTALGEGPGRADFQRARGHTDADWDAAADRLRERGWLDRTGGPTERSRLARLGIESVTDRLAEPTWHALGPENVAECAAALAPIAARAAETIRWPNPIGLPDPRAGAGPD
jgi:hypothetical protein